MLRIEDLDRAQVKPGLLCYHGGGQFGVVIEWESEYKTELLIYWPAQMQPYKQIQPFTFVLTNENGEPVYSPELYAELISLNR